MRGLVIQSNRLSVCVLNRDWLRLVKPDFRGVEWLIVKSHLCRLMKFYCRLVLKLSAPVFVSVYIEPCLIFDLLRTLCLELM